jgi:hypothetical protein
VFFHYIQRLRWKFNSCKKFSYVFNSCKIVIEIHLQSYICLYDAALGPKAESEIWVWSYIRHMGSPIPKAQRADLQPTSTCQLQPIRTHHVTPATSTDEPPRQSPRSLTRGPGLAVASAERPCIKSPPRHCSPNHAAPPPPLLTGLRLLRLRRQIIRGGTRRW